MTFKSTLLRQASLSLGLCAVFTAGALFAPVDFATAQSRSGGAVVAGGPNGAPSSFADLIEHVSPAVVQINVVTEIPQRNLRFSGPDGLPDLDQLPPQFREFFRRFNPEDLEPEPREGRGQGSGFFISEDGFLVTNNHVVENATEIRVILDNGDDYEAELVGRDPETDMAVLKVDADEAFAFVEFAETTEDLRVGDWVVAVGNPFGLGGTATAGIISAIGRGVGNSLYNEFIQIDAPINRGNSGGPTFDLSGHVIGVNSQIFSPSGGSVGIGFAIPSDVAARITKVLIENGTVERGWLGVEIGAVNENQALSLGLEGTSGALVNTVVPDSPADQAGFEPGDVILAMNGVDVEDNRQLTRLVGELRVSERAEFTIWRNDSEAELTAVIGSRIEGLGRTDTQSRPSSDGPRQASELGLSVRNLDDRARSELELGEEVSGVVVTSVTRRSDAEQEGFRPGDVITEVQRQAVDDVDAFEAAVEDVRASGRPAVLLTVVNRLGSRLIGLPFDTDENG
ncbi:MAG: Do family serine endopeptidase [Maricaulaceae bacterium]